MKLHGVLAAAGAVVLGLAAQTQAGPLPGSQVPAVQVTATSSLGDSFSASPVAVLNPDGSTYHAQGETQKPTFSLTFDLTLNPDPSIIGTFTLTTLSSSTQFFSVSATMAVLPIAAPTKMGGSFGDVTYTDTSHDSTVTLATNGTDPFYSALIDAVKVQGLGSFNATAFGGPGAFGTISKTSFGTPIPSAIGPAVVSNIGVSFPAFSLTPGDQVEVPFEFVVSAPEPSFASLFAIGITLILLATSRRKFLLGV